MNKTKIVSTIGPSSSDYNVLKQMALSGVSVFRLNMAYASLEFAREVILDVRRISLEISKEIGIMLDTRGPELRIGGLEKPIIHLEKDKIIRIIDSNIIGNSEMISVNEKMIVDHTNVGNSIYLNNAAVKLVVINKDENTLVCRILNDGDIISESTLNIPDIKFNINFLSNYDKEVIKFAVNMQVDYLALSHVREEIDVLDVNDLLISLNDNNIQIISKIENKDALEEMDKILNASDGVIISRGDLGIEMSLERIPRLQKVLAKKIKEKEKICVISTEMLSSMKTNIKPTRAEICDIANAVLDNVDALMLGEETAIGNYPLEVVKVMKSTIEDIEKDIDYKEHLINVTKNKNIGISKAISYSSCEAAREVNARAIVCSTLSGVTAKDISNYKPCCPLIAISPNSKVVRGLSINYGIIPMTVGQAETTDELVEISKRAYKKAFETVDNDKIVIVGTFPLHDVNYTNFLKIEEVKKED
jgi:pyruvate kinase